ncbi:hypothetical protein [Anaerolentibacter hominis]
MSFLLGFIQYLIKYIFFLAVAFGGIMLGKKVKDVRTARKSGQD